VCVCAQGHCSEFKVIANSHTAVEFGVERMGVVLKSKIDRETTPFVMFDVIANCSSSDNLFRVIRTQAGLNFSSV